MNRTEKLKEVREALEAADRAIISLETAKDQLSSARNWGVWDVIGGGFVSTMVKRSKMNRAEEAMEEAKRYLNILKKELLDVQVPENFKLEVGDFLVFADYFFDGFFADLWVQTKINDAAIKVEAAIEDVRRIQDTLNRMMMDMEKQESEGGWE